MDQLIRTLRAALLAPLAFSGGTSLGQVVTWAPLFGPDGPHVQSLSATGRYWTGADAGTAVRGDLRAGSVESLPSPELQLGPGYTRWTSGVGISSDGATVITRTLWVPGTYLLSVRSQFDEVRREALSGHFFEGYSGGGRVVSYDYWDLVALSEDGDRSCYRRSTSHNPLQSISIRNSAGEAHAPSAMLDDRLRLIGASGDLSRYLLALGSGTGGSTAVYDEQSASLISIPELQTPLAISPDGNCVIGFRSYYGGRPSIWSWTDDAGSRELAAFSSFVGVAWAHACGADGRFALVGTVDPENQRRDLYVLEGDRLSRLSDLLRERGAALPAGIHSLSLVGASSDGAVVVVSYSRDAAPNSFNQIIIRELFPAAPDVELVDDGQTPARGLGRTFSVRYLTGSGLDPASIGRGDLEARTPTGQRLPMILAGTPRPVEGGAEVEYTFEARGDAAPTNGDWEYQIWLRPGEVRDRAGVLSPMRFVGHIRGHSGEPRTVLEDWSADDGMFRAIVRHVDVAGAPIGISWTSVGDGDVELTGPSGSPRRARVVRRTIVAPAELLAAYEFAPRGAYWNWTDNGEYTLSMRAGEVWDEQGHLVEPGLLAGTTLNIQTPAAAVVSVSARAGYSDMRVTMSYRANGRFMSWGSLGAGDLELRGPGGFISQATLLSRRYNSINNSYTVVYSLPARGGAWDTSDNGAYSLWFREGQVWDALGYAVPGVQVGGYWLWF